MTSEKLASREQSDLISLRKEIETLRTEMNVKIDAIGEMSIVIVSLLLTAPFVKENATLKNEIAELKSKIKMQSR